MFIILKKCGDNVFLSIKQVIKLYLPVTCLFFALMPANVAILSTGISASSSFLSSEKKPTRGSVPVKTENKSYEFKV